jgi:hypothetical protein
MLSPDVIAKLNECAKADFGSIRDLWFGRLSLSTDLVIAGLALEVFELVYEAADIARERIRFLKYRVAIVERHVQVAKLIAFIGWFLIVGGVAGERFSEARVKNADANIQECSDARLARTTEEAVDAEFKATPRWRAMAMNGAWQTLIDELKGKPASKFEILYAPADEEAYTFAVVLEKTLKDSGWASLGTRSLKESDALEGKWGDIPGAPLATRSGAWYGMALISKTGIPNPPWEHDKESAIAALIVGLGGGQGVPDPRMPDNVIRIVIGQAQSGH